MFVKICRETGVEELRECDTVIFNPQGQGQGEGGTDGNLRMSMLIDKKGERLIVDIDDGIVGVYTMSETGRTIDAKHF